MEGYVLSLLGIVLVSVLIEIILPSGDTAKYIKSIVAIFVVYILVNPIVMFLKKDFDIAKYINEKDLEINRTLVANMYLDQIETREKDIEKQLYDNGYQNVEVNIEFSIINDQLKFKKVLVNIEKLVITGQNQNINKYQYIRQVIVKNILIEEENVIFE